MGTLTVCTRVSVGDGVILRSFAGLSVRAHNGYVHTFLFDNRDPNLSVQLLGRGDRSEFLAIFHVFLGEFLKTLTQKDVEIFRFHGDVWPSYLAAEDEPPLHGELIHLAPGQKTTARHSYEHLGGLILTDAMHLSANMQAGAPLHTISARCTPDPEIYRVVAPHLPHPGMFHEDDPAEMIESWLDHEAASTTRRVM